MASQRSAVRPTYVIAAIVLAGFAGAAAIVLLRGQPAVAATTTSHPVSAPPRLDALTAAHDVKAIMTGVVDPAADGIWNSHGAIATPTSDESWAPSTDEDWRRLEGHARALQRGADALLEPARVNGRAGWIDPARSLRAAADRALTAVRQRSVEGLSAASEGLLDACQQCHKAHWLPTGVEP